MITNKAGTYSKNDIVIKKFHSSGAVITSGWNKTIDYGHSDNEVPNKILFDGTNIIMIGTGYDSISGSSGSDGLFYVYDTAGTLKTSIEIPYWYDSSYNSDRCSYIGKDSNGKNSFTASPQVKDSKILPKICNLNFVPRLLKLHKFLHLGILL